MCMVCQVVHTTTAGATMFAVATAPVQQPQGNQLTNLQQLPATVAKFTPPTFEKKPQWYDQQIAAEKARATSAANVTAAKPASGRVVTYAIGTKGATSSDLNVFAAQVNQTLNDSRGWARLGVSFQQVQRDGSFSLILSEASQVPSFSSACDTEWSCRVGSSVIINDNRWGGASDAWNASGGSLRDYRHMVVNHEVGHWLGHGHLNCPAAGQTAPLMQQQSISLQGCAFNPWPLEAELWSTQLGIR